jgi:hypothetical protein
MVKKQKKDCRKKRNSGAPPVEAGGSFPKRDIPRLAECIQPHRKLGAFCSGVNDLMEISGEPERSMLRRQSRHAASNYYPANHGYETTKQALETNFM